MSLKEVLSHNYAKAIAKYYGDVLNEFVFKREIIERHTDFFSNPRVSVEDKVSVLKTNLAPIFSIIFTKNHLNILGNIETFLRSILNKKSDVTHFYIESVEADISNIVKILESKYNKVVITHEINPDLIGGFILKYADYVIDMSVKRQLNDLRNLEL